VRTDRILTALLLGPMTRRQIADALHRSPTWADVGVRSLVSSRHAIRIGTPHYITGKITWRYALTQRGTIAAHQRISA
jgi:hypothetical protein